MKLLALTLLVHAGSAAADAKRCVVVTDGSDKKTYSLDAKGRVTGIDSNVRVVWKGDRIERVEHVGADGKPTRSYDYTYGPHGELVRLVATKENGKSEEWYKATYRGTFGGVLAVKPSVNDIDQSMWLLPSHLPLDGIVAFPRFTGKLAAVHGQPQSSQIECEFGSNGRATRCTDNFGNDLSYRYDAKARVTRIVRDKEDLVAGKTESYTYVGDRLTRVEGKNTAGKTVFLQELGYDVSGRLTRLVQKRGDHVDFTKTYTYACQ